MKKRPDPDEGGCPLWVVTFGDAMSLLVTFFVMLVSFADFEEHALQDMLGAMKGGLRAVPMPMATAQNRVDHSIAEDDSENVATLTSEDVAIDTGQGVILEQAVGHDLQSHMPDYYIQLLDNGISLVINQQAVFEYGTARLLNGAEEPWLLAAGLMRAVNNEVRVTVILPRNAVVLERGCHTAWGLGVEQALSAQRQLVSMSGEAAEQLGTSVQVVDHMPSYTSYSYEGCIEIRFVGSVKALMDCMPARILNGEWLRKTVMTEEAPYGQRS
ncbi:MAG: hypothetical protein JXR25_04780 [Pontiellaceae bacterium]|nr:hypothetical protein [Pontiellaceae bacterium]MBN2784121.1 hypothetical protein [Pontiellaceae bacterium]